MTKEEREALELQLCEAKIRCKESWQVLVQLNKITKTYLEDWRRWERRFEEADRKLAEVDGRLKVVEDKKSVKEERKLTKEELRALIAEIEEMEESVESDD